MTPIYIRAAACISPTATIGGALPPSVKPAGKRLTCVEPDYKGLIDPKALRRMSRIIRMGVATAKACLGEKMPDAIVTGTGYGCLEDTGLFLTSMIERKEETLAPGAFIQSTHNTVGAQIALLLPCTGYNNTFVHRGFSFESAVLDAILLLQEGEVSTVLAGGIDELTDAGYAILTRFGLYRQALAGEGAAFFLLSNQPANGDYAKLEGVATFYKPEDPAGELAAFLQEHPGTIDLVIGDEILAGIPTLPYKSQVGEYPTSTAYACWLAATLIKTGVHKRILVYNQYLGIHHAAFLLTKIDQ